MLLLNRSLTVAPGQPNSHRGRGWEAVTEAAVRALAARGGPLVAILWGRNARDLKPLLGATPCIESAHPSPLSAHNGFFGSRPVQPRERTPRRAGRRARSTGVCRRRDTRNVVEPNVTAGTTFEHCGMPRIHRILLAATAALGVCAPNALAAPTAVIDTSATPITCGQALCVGYVTSPGVSVGFGALYSDPGPGSDNITKVEFDLNGNGTYDYTSTDPLRVARWTFQAPARDVTIKLRVTNTAGQTDEAKPAAAGQHPAAGEARSARHRRRGNAVHG